LELKGLDPSVFQFSILEIVPATTTADGVIECENRWKEKLGTRQFRCATLPPVKATLKCL